MEQARINRAPIPEKIKNAPALMPGLELFYRAFVILSPSRYPAFSGVNRLPWPVVQAYAEAWRMDEEQTFRLHYLLAAMDTAYIQHVEGKKNGTIGGGDATAQQPEKPSRPAIGVNKRR